MAGVKSQREKELEALRGKGLTRGFRNSLQKSRGAPLSTPELEAAFIAKQRAVIKKKEPIAPAKYIKSVAELGKWRLDLRARDSVVRDKIAEAQAYLRTYRGPRVKEEPYSSLPSVADVKCPHYTPKQPLQVKKTFLLEDVPKYRGNEANDFYLRKDCSSPTSVFDFSDKACGQEDAIFIKNAPASPQQYSLIVDFPVTAHSKSFDESSRKDEFHFDAISNGDVIKATTSIEGRLDCEKQTNSIETVKSVEGNKTEEAIQYQERDVSTVPSLLADAQDTETNIEPNEKELSHTAISEMNRDLREELEEEESITSVSTSTDDFSRFFWRIIFKVFPVQQTKRIAYDECADQKEDTCNICVQLLSENRCSLSVVHEEYLVILWL
uniref:Uncharacterized protein n=1 Tax=Ditylum brightwellii TaxID=49249 RepID=A0A7S1ZIV2_9STRA